jgi:hypothetical protein
MMHFFLCNKLNCKSVKNFTEFIKKDRVLIIDRTIKTNYIKWVKRQEEDNEIEIKSEIIILILL